MDAIVFIAVALILVLRPSKPALLAIDDESSVPEDITREARINESYYEDPDAFSEMINELGFPKERS